jgi:hypothetical protein
VLSLSQVTFAELLVIEFEEIVVTSLHTGIKSSSSLLQLKKRLLIKINRQIFLNIWAALFTKE